MSTFAFGGLVAQYQVPPGSGAEVFPEGMRRTADNKWTVYGMSGTDLEGSRLTAAAYCNRGSVPRVVTKTVALAGLQVASAIATCPSGTFVVGGGYNSGAALQHIELVGRLERLTPTEWVVTMVNIMPTATTVTADRVLRRRPRSHPGRDHDHAGGAQGWHHAGELPEGNLDRVRGCVRRRAPSPERTFSQQSRRSAGPRPARRSGSRTGYNAGNTAGNLNALAYCR